MTVDHAVEVQEPAAPGARFLGPSPSAGRVAQDALQPGREGVRVGRGHQFAATLDQLGGAPDVGGHDRPAGRHRFHHGVAHALGQ
jgi:hypothetical protein